MKFKFLLLFLIIVCQTNLFGQETTESDSVNSKKPTVNIYVGSNINTFGADPKVDEFLFMSLDAQAYRNRSVGFNFALYSEGSKQNYTDGTELVYQHYVVEFMPTFKLWNNNGFNIYMGPEASLYQANLRQQDPMSNNTIDELRQYFIAPGVGFIFDIVNENVDIQIRPSAGYMFVRGNLVNDPYFDDNYYVKLRFHVRDVVDKISVGSSFISSANAAILFLNVSYRIELSNPN